MFTVAIIGRPNVGKSTLFNRILGRRQAIVKDFPGVTRDRHYAECEYRGRRFQLVDTGGLVPSADEQMFSLIREQSSRAIAEADALIFLMDGREGLTPLDQEIADLLRGVKKPVFVAINKIDTPKSDPLISDFYVLGMAPLYPLSAEHGVGVAELLDALYPLLPAATEGAATEDIPKVAVVGRPNVGKSTFINTLLGEPRLVVNDIPGTTRDTIEEVINLRGIPMRIIDTAGLRPAVDEVERKGIARTEKSLELADLLLHIVDRNAPKPPDFGQPASEQGELLLLNKSDLPEHPDWRDCTALRISCLTEDGLRDLEEKILEGIAQRNLRAQSAVAINTRHRGCLRRALEACDRARTAFEEGISAEYFAVDLHSALDAVGEVIGAVGVEEILDSVFSQFCIGK